MTDSSLKAAPVDDSDLEDLLQHKGGEKETSEAPLNLDDLTKGKLDVPRRSISSPSIRETVAAQCRYLCFMYPRCCACITTTSIALFMFLFVGILLDPTRTFGEIKVDFSNISSEYDLKIGKIDHWCLKGDNDSCRCEDPLEPTSRIEYKTWTIAHKANKKSIEAYSDSVMIDVAFLGESIVEQMDGRWMGHSEGVVLKKIEKSFKRQFKADNSGIEGVALGIAGDTSPNVLWRLLNGEMPANFNPRVWWIVLGMNDLGRMQCSEEVVVMGILRVVEEIRTRKPDAKIVINSMLPMANLRGAMFPNKIDFMDAIRDKKGRPMRPSSSIDVSHFGRAGGGVVGPDIIPKIEYSRPKTTTNALLNRHKDTAGFQTNGVRKSGKPMADLTMPSSPGKIGGTKLTQSKNDLTGEFIFPTVGATGDSGAPVKNPPKGAVKEIIKNETGHTDQEDNDDHSDSEENESDEDRQGKRILNHLNEKMHNEKHDDKLKTISGKDKIRAQVKKEEAKTEKKFIKKVKRDPVNPKLNSDMTKIKARDPKALFLKKNKLPIWTSIYAINKELKHFVEKQGKNISFFDATNIFAERSTDGRHFILQSDKISVRGHPTELGFARWEEAVAKKLKKMLTEDDETIALEVKSKQENADEP